MLPFTRNSKFASNNLRNATTGLRLPKKNMSKWAKMLSYRRAKLWNSPSSESKQASLLGSLKKYY